MPETQTEPIKQPVPVQDVYNVYEVAELLSMSKTRSGSSRDDRKTPFRCVGFQASEEDRSRFETSCLRNTC